MNVNVKCFAQLSMDRVCDYKGSNTHELPEGTTIEGLIAKLGLPRDEIKVIFLNSTIVSVEHVLRDGDQVAFAPVTGGM